MRTLRVRGTVAFKRLFEKSESRSEIVATFLAVLELVKANRLQIDGQGSDSKVTVIDKRSKK